MTVQASRVVTLKVGGTPTTMTGEACGAVVEFTSFQVTAAKSVVDPATAVDVFVDGVESADADYSIDYPTGLITFDSDVGDNPVTITGKYVPLLTVAEAKALKVVRPQPVFADATLLGDTAPRVVEIAKRCEITLTAIRAPHEDLDSGGGTTTLESLLAGGEPIFVEAALGADETLRGWFVADPETRSGGLDEPLSLEITLKGVVRTCVGRTAEQALFSIT